MTEANNTRCALQRWARLAGRAAYVVGAAWIWLSTYYHYVFSGRHQCLIGLCDLEIAACTALGGFLLIPAHYWRQESKARRDREWRARFEPERPPAEPHRHKPENDR